MPRKKKKPSKDELVWEWFSWINSTNADELKKSFEKYLAANGYSIQEMK